MMRTLFLRFSLAFCCMLGALAVGAFVSAATLILHLRAFYQPGLTVTETMRGALASAWEETFETSLRGKEVATAPWGAVRFALFATGSRGVVIGADGWLYTAEEFEPAADGRKEEKENLEQIERLNAYLASRGIRLIVALIPAKARVYPEHLGAARWPAERQAVYARFRKELLQRRIATPDLLGAFLQAKDGAPLFMRTDTHWTPEGAALAAHLIAAHARESCGVALGKKTRYATAAQEEETYAGDLTRFVPTGALRPWVGPEPEPLVRRKTRPLVATASAGLFAEEKIPAALVGTSYSFEPQWNFEGALKEALASDVLNIAEEGQGPMGPMAKFLRETDFERTPVRLVIWEFPERFIPVAAEESLTVPALPPLPTHPPLKACKREETS